MKVTGWTADGVPRVANGDQSSTKTVEEGAATTVWCALSAQLDNLGGVYCADCDISPIVPDDSNSASLCYAAAAADTGPASTSRLLTGSTRRLSPSSDRAPRSVKSVASPKTTSSVVVVPAA